MAEAAGAGGGGAAGRRWVAAGAEDLRPPVAGRALPPAALPAARPPRDAVGNRLGMAASDGIPDMRYDWASVACIQCDICCWYSACIRQRRRQ